MIESKPSLPQAPLSQHPHPTLSQGERESKEGADRRARGEDRAGVLPEAYTIPCGRLVETDAAGAAPRCEAERTFPSDCHGCDEYSPGLTAQERTSCEVWTRVMGYHRPVAQFNPGKQSEHAERRLFLERPGDLRRGR